MRLLLHSGGYRGVWERWTAELLLICTAFPPLPANHLVTISSFVGMSYPYPYQSPGLDPNKRVSDPFLQNTSSLPYNGNANSAYNVPSGGSPIPNTSGNRKPQPAIVSLWKEQLAAMFAGTITLALGGMVLAAYFDQGPLESLFIPEGNYDGPVVNPSNTGALIAGLATIISVIARYVAAGISRAWLRRLAVSGRGASIRQWTTISAGISMRDVRRTPFIAGGVILLFTLAMAINTTALVGAGLPNIRYKTVLGSYGPAIPFSGNGGAGQLVNCLSLAETMTCASSFSTAVLVSAFQNGFIVKNPGAYYTWGTAAHISGDVYLASIDPLAANDTLTSEDIIRTPVSKYNATCHEITDAGIDSARGRYYWKSPCFGEYRVFGNSTIPGGDWIAGATCGWNDESTSIEIAYAGTNVNGRNTAFAYTCDVYGYEGRGTSWRHESGTTEIAGPEDESSYVSLTASEMNSTVTAFLASIQSESGLGGKIGPIGVSLSSGIRELGTDDALLRLARAVSNALAASATDGYNALASRNSYTYPNTIPSMLSSRGFKGYGWSKTPRSLGWSIVCIGIGVAWYAAVIYMVRGGTRYDPTDWFQTINTSAGSNLSQIQGTCTGAGLQSRKLKKTELWYGEIAPGHVGFAQQPTSVVNPGHKYGQVPSEFV